MKLNLPKNLSPSQQIDYINEKTDMRAERLDIYFMHGNMIT